MAINNSYRYLSLNEAKKQIRIFNLAPGEANQPVCGSLEIISIERLHRSKVPAGLDEFCESEPSLNIKWTALSYAWGHFAREKTIILSSKVLVVTQNLYDALQYLRDPYKDRILWIDQICVNQEDKVERAHQVQMMQEIYVRATNVIAWLGTDTAAVTDVFDAIQGSGENVSTIDKVEHMVKMQLSLANEQQELLQSVLHLNTSDVNLEQALKRLCRNQDEMMENAWFKRLWTLQEAVFGYTLNFQAGRRMVSWEDVFFSFWLLNQFRRTHEIPGTVEVFQKIFNIEIFRQHLKTPDASYSLTRYSLSDVRVASDDRDYVYGQLGLWHPRAIDFVQPDYSASVENVFMAGTIALIRASGNLDALWNSCGSSQNCLRKLPSWCWDWAAKWSRGFDHTSCGVRYAAWISSERNHYRAASKKALEIVQIAGSGALCVRGIQIDEISGGIFGRNKEKLPDAYQAWELIRKVFLSYDSTFDKEELYEAICRTLIHDVIDSNARATRAQLTMAINWLRKLEKQKELNDSLLCEDFNDKYNQNRVSDALLSTASIFFTAAGRIGKSCKHVRPGDKICLLYGGRLPFILREGDIVDLTDEKSDAILRQTYQLIGGECYVDGLVDGEGIEMTERDEIPEQDFCLI